MNPRDGLFPKRPTLYIWSLKGAGFAGSGVKISFILRGSISMQGPKIIIFRSLCIAFLLGSFGPGVIIRMNLRDGIFPIWREFYFSSLTRSGFAESGVKISCNVVVVFQHKGPKSSFSVVHVALSYSIRLDLEWKSGWLHVMAFFQKHPKCIFQDSKWLVLLDLESK